MKKIWKKIMALGMAAAMVVTALPSGAVAKTTADIETPDTPLPFVDLGSEEIIREMGIGINLGNTLDGHSGYMPGELNWNSVITTKEIVRCMHDLGYNTLRVPVTWGKMINDDYSIDETWMSRVQEVVDYAISENMYVILNIHHDGAEGDVPQGGWLHVGGTDEEFAKTKTKFEGVWKTIATRFKNYDEHLILESMNEVLGTGGDDLKHVNEELARINELNQAFVDVVRATGSNNTKRWLDVPTRVTNINTMIGEGYEFKVPQDSAKRVMVAGHDYDAWSVSSFNENIASGYAGQFKALKEKYVDQGVPVVIGEFGVLGGHITQFRAEGISYLLKKYHLIGCLWDAEGDDGIIDRTNRVARYKNVTDGMMRGYFTDTDSAQIKADPEVTALTSFQLSDESVTMEPMERKIITVSNCQPQDNNDVVLWKSDNALIASVSAGNIIARAPGKTTIRAFSQSGTVEKTIEVTVASQKLSSPSEDIVVSSENITLEEGDETFLNATVSPAENGASVSYFSSKESVASVSTVGRILAKKKGTAEITMITSDGLEKKITVTVETAKDTGLDSHLAIHVLYNGDYSGTEVGSDVVRAQGDGTYTLKFDCSTDLSDAAKAAGVTDLNNIGSLYIYDYDVTSGLKKKSTSLAGKVSYSSIKINGQEMLTAPTGEYNAIKSSVFDTNNPINAWDGSVFNDGIATNSKKFRVTFTDIENPTTAEITFTLTGFSPKPEETPHPEESAQPTETPKPDQMPTEVTDVTTAPKQNGITKLSAAKKTISVKKKKTAKVLFKVTAAGMKKADVKKKCKISVSGKKNVKILKKTFTESKVVITVKGIKKGKAVVQVKADKLSAKTTVKVK